MEFKLIRTQGGSHKEDGVEYKHASVDFECINNKDLTIHYKYESEKDSLLFFAILTNPLTGEAVNLGNNNVPFSLTQVAIPTLQRAIMDIDYI